MNIGNNTVYLLKCSPHQLPLTTINIYCEIEKQVTTLNQYLVTTKVNAKTPKQIIFKNEKKNY